MQFHLRKPNPHHIPFIDLNGTVFGKQRHGARLGLALLVNLDGLLPGRLLLIINLTQIKNMPLNDLVAGATLVLDDAPIAMVLAIFLPGAATQKHNGIRLSTEKWRWEQGRSALQTL
jgi:hypothetical protein